MCGRLQLRILEILYSLNLESLLQVGSCKLSASTCTHLHIVPIKVIDIKAKDAMIQSSAGYTAIATSSKVAGRKAITNMYVLVTAEVVIQFVACHVKTMFPSPKGHWNEWGCTFP